MITTDLFPVRPIRLYEAMDYAGMFNQVLNLLPGRGITVERVIRQTRRRLRRNDRIVWFLRYWRLAFVEDAWQDAVDQQTPGPGYDSVLTKLTQLRDRLTRGLPPSTIPMRSFATSADQYLAKLEHFFSLPIPEIQHYELSQADPSLVLRDFEAAEKRWQGDRAGLITVQQAATATPILEFGHGLAWWNLHQAHCPAEADAMGHCGNQPRADSDDRILSLRQTLRKNGVTFYKPYLTFILDAAGQLGEMKGRFNKSPDQAYRAGDAPSNFHREIVALLKLPLIQGIKGGGFAPEDNFKLDDLDKATRDALLDSKPALQPLWWRFAEFGLTKQIIGQITTFLRAAISNPAYLPEHGGFLVHVEDRLEFFIMDFVVKASYALAACKLALQSDAISGLVVQTAMPRLIEKFGSEQAIIAAFDSWLQAPQVAPPRRGDPRCKGTFFLMQADEDTTGDDEQRYRAPVGLVISAQDIVRLMQSGYLTEATLSNDWDWSWVIQFKDMSV